MDLHSKENYTQLYLTKMLLLSYTYSVYEISRAPKQTKEPSLPGSTPLIRLTMIAGIFHVGNWKNLVFSVMCIYLSAFGTC